MGSSCTLRSPTTPLGITFPICQGLQFYTGMEGPDPGAISSFASGHSVLIGSETDRNGKGCCSPGHRNTQPSKNMSKRQRLLSVALLCVSGRQSKFASACHFIFVCYFRLCLAVSLPEHSRTCFWLWGRERWIRKKRRVPPPLADLAGRVAAPLPHRGNTIQQCHFCWGCRAPLNSWKDGHAVP